MGIYLQKRPDGTTYGSLVIDRIISGKRLKLSTGSKDKKTVRKMNDLLNPRRLRNIHSFEDPVDDGVVNRGK